MANLISMTEDCVAVKDKIVAFCIKEKKTLQVWVYGGGIINNNYTTEEECKTQFENLYKIMREEP